MYGNLKGVINQLKKKSKSKIKKILTGKINIIKKLTRK